MKSWLGIRPPGFILTPPTQRPPLPRLPTKPDDLHAAERLVRDMHWNPQRHLARTAASNPEVLKLIEEKEKVIAAEPSHKVARKQWFQKLSMLTERLSRFMEKPVAVANGDLANRQREMDANELLMRRDYAWCLFPEPLLSNYCARIMNAS